MRKGAYIDDRTSNDRVTVTEVVSIVAGCMS